MERKRHSTPYIFSESSSDSNEPLDMTKKCCKTYEQSGTISYGQLQQQRPSVITCAPALMHSHCQRTDHSHSVGHPSHGGDNIKPGYRREIVAGMCDSVIDEHFRRSLGKDYPEFLSSATPTAPSVSVTVDDHFAKALGDIWLRLQQTKSGRRDITTLTPAASGPRLTSGSPSSSTLLQHPQEIVST
ncbi:transcription cofactor vestigial-like protein 4 [Tachypleus tridentatus]|uniref:transcription cofactor vestigial-like protein 4 n=1 Tax=Tachypleus tridentatus TaxID=6853 RepID=UPI003FD64946